MGWLSVKCKIQNRDFRIRRHYAKINIFFNITIAMSNLKCYHCKKILYGGENPFLELKDPRNPDKLIIVCTNSQCISIVIDNLKKVDKCKNRDCKNEKSKEDSTNGYCMQCHEGIQMSIKDITYFESRINDIASETNKKYHCWMGRITVNTKYD